MTAQFIAEIWAEETAEALKCIEGLWGGLPQPPHRRLFRWWHRRFCAACQDYQVRWDEALAENIKKYAGQTLNIPRFDMLN